MSSHDLERLSIEELEAECGALLPSKEVLSVPLLDLNADINLALDLAAPIDLAVAGNANVVLPINAAVSANALSILSTAQAGGGQGVALDQFISGHAIAHGDQTSGIDQTGSGAVAGASLAALGPATDHPAGTDSTGATGGLPAPTTDVAQPTADATHPAEPVQPAAVTQPAAADSGESATTPVQPAAADTAQPADAAQPAAAAADPTAADETTPSLEGGLLNVDVKVDLDSKLAAPIAGAVALNANVAAPINGAVSANVGTIGSQAVAVAEQTAIMSQQMQDVTAEAVTNQNAEIDQ